MYIFFIHIYSLPLHTYINTYKIMSKVSKIITEKILKDNDFSLDVAKLLGIQQYSVKELAKRSSDRLVLYNIVEFYKTKGFSIEDIFEKEPQSHE